MTADLLRLRWLRGPLPTTGPGERTRMETSRATLCRSARVADALRHVLRHPRPVVVEAYAQQQMAALGCNSHLQHRLPAVGSASCEVT